jgi:hypothetical protein
MGIDSAKQHALLTVLLEAQADRDERLAQLLRAFRRLDFANVFGSSIAAGGICPDVSSSVKEF